MKYLGHTVSRKGVVADPSKLQAIIDWSVPANVKVLRRFLGLTRYYMKLFLAMAKYVNLQVD